MGAAPLTLRCKKCSYREYWRDRPRRDSSYDLYATGKTKVVRKYGSRRDVKLYQIQHSCGHVFWSNHPTADTLYYRWQRVTAIVNQPFEEKP